MLTSKPTIDIGCRTALSINGEGSGSKYAANILPANIPKVQIADMEIN